ncbi:hypothetical protein [Brevifollis gellanilyticus]|uniref:Uncharacterized protein n=1 Tax=Brevifollis gellanilyticus TaxID=748831 RepID=A0A512MD40_9BACT|nr:hypothetical protein [Brevifollis gellanilyticus]GEP44653.1 hypothetical protein BGE01nite_39440 [Brevifollis gellanilyticus]
MSGIDPSFRHSPVRPSGSFEPDSSVPQDGGRLGEREVVTNPKSSGRGPATGFFQGIAERLKSFKSRIADYFAAKVSTHYETSLELAADEMLEAVVKKKATVDHMLKLIAELRKIAATGGADNPVKKALAILRQRLDIVPEEQRNAFRAYFSTEDNSTVLIHEFGRRLQKRDQLLQGMDEAGLDEGGQRPDSLEDLQIFQELLAGIQHECRHPPKESGVVG